MADEKFYRSVAGMSPSSPAAKSVKKGDKKEGKREEGKESKEDKGKDHPSDPHDIRGEPLTGYEDRVVDGVDKGEFECANCSFFVGPVGGKGAKRGEKGCNQLDMRQKSEREKFPDGRVKVDTEGCCTWVDRIGKPESPVEEKKEGEKESAKK